MTLNLDGRECGFCLKGKLHFFKDEAFPGIFVDSYKCDVCKEIAYTQEVMGKVEAMRRGDSETRSLIKIGASLAISIPVEIVKRLKLKPKGKVYISAKGNEIIARVARG
ncbi:MAG: AbrB/MazE/SpoVT family DNA-binding domain-containing protein [Candidatus Micrarchaeota archaeon]